MNKWECEACRLENEAKDFYCFACVTARAESWTLQLDNLADDFSVQQAERLFKQCGSLAEGMESMTIGKPRRAYVVMKPHDREGVELLWKLNGKRVAGKKLSITVVDPMASILDRVTNDMVTDKKTRALVHKYKLDLVQVAWEDNARNEQSAWGPCITDLTLQVKDRLLPIIRHPNFTDATWDTKLDDIRIMVGNESNQPLSSTTLRAFLDKYSLLTPVKDTHALFSAQTCFLPVGKGDKDETLFRIRLNNYQNKKLILVATAQGTSAQVVGEGEHTLYFNRNGQRASFCAKRLSVDRKERGVAVVGKVSKQEQEQNVIMVIQVPLEASPSQPVFSGQSGGGLGGLDFGFAEECAFGEMESEVFRSHVLFGGGGEEKADVEHAIVKAGNDEGPFPALDWSSQDLKRNHTFTVRVTLQFYKCTANGVVGEDEMRDMAQQLAAARPEGQVASSLVVPKDKKQSRPTEPRVKRSPVHEHDLSFAHAKNRKCDGCQKDGLKLAVLPDFFWRCTQCGFDLCDVCMQAVSAPK